MTTTIEKDVDQALTELGFTLDVQTIDPGEYKKPSVHRVEIIARRGRPSSESFAITYTMGPLRLWKTRLFFNQTRAHDLAVLPVRNGKEARLRKDYKRQGDWVKSYDENTTHRPVTLADVMHSLVMDASCVRNGQSFDDFCSEFGYDNDSIKARKCFDGCRDEWSGLIRLGVDLDQLDELFQDY